MSVGNTSILEEQLPTKHSIDEIRQVTEYAESKGIKLYQPNAFDGDLSVLKDQIDAISEIRDEYSIKSKLTIEFKDMFGGDLAETSRTGSSISFNRNVLRNREATNKYLSSDNQLATDDVKGIAYHEMGHILAIKHGEKGIDIAHKAYYNIHKKNISDGDLLDYLESNVSEYCSYLPDKYADKPFVAKHYKEIIPEIISKDKTNPNEFTRQFTTLLKEAYNL